ncbi:hypothetical protein WA158_007018 [Blastocystis sp. Blastoise]
MFLSRVTPSFVYWTSFRRFFAKSINIKSQYPELFEHLSPPSKQYIESHPEIYKKTVLEWVCEVGSDHTWKQSLGQRLNSYNSIHRFNCPFCCGARFSITNSVAKKNPGLLKYWDYERNGSITPETISYQSHKSIFWQCPNHKDHHFKKAPFQMALIKEGYCPYCDNQIISDSSRITTNFPDIAKEWDKTKNTENVEDVMYTSFKNYWWKCSKNPEHIYQCTPYYRCVLKQECPYCTNSRVSSTYNLALIYPEVAEEWHPTKNGGLLPTDVMPSGRQKIWWQCKQHPEHEWMASIYNRISGTGCPICADRGRYKKIPESKTLSSVYPDIYKEIDTSTIKDTDKISNLSSKSVRLLTWKCTKHNYIYQQKVIDRVKMEAKHTSMCPECAKELSIAFPKEKTENKTHKKQKNSKNVLKDI